MKLRSFSQKYFSKPLTYEYYLKELHRFERVRHADGEIVNRLVDFIHSNRQLQRSNKVVVNNFLDIKLTPSNSKLELELWNLLNKYPVFPGNDILMQNYLNIKPQPTNINHIFDSTAKKFESQLKQGEIDLPLINNSLNLLLDQRDYYNGFKLIDLTIGSPNYFQFLKNNLKSKLSKLFWSNVGLIGLAVSLLPSYPLTWLCLINVVSTSLILCVNFQIVNKIGKLSWRSYNSSWHNYLHQQELLMVNKIITHYEEHNEVNIRNFHHSRVRFQSNLHVLDQDDYILELPSNSQELVAVDHSSLQDTNKHIQQYFRHQLYKRRLVLGELPEELIFFEYWLTNGDDFEWVEPDQDPAEILKLKIDNNV